MGNTLNLLPCSFTSLFLFDKSTIVASVLPATNAATLFDEPGT